MQENTLIQINRIEGDIRQGGVMVTGRVDGDTDALAYGDNLRLVGKSNSSYDDPEWRQFFNGHVLEDPDYDFDALTSSFTFKAGTANYLMRGRIQDVAFTEQASPANDHQLAVTMRLSGCFSHLISSHCNFLYNATTNPHGIIFTTDYDTSDTALSRFNFNKSKNMWPALVQQLGGGDEKVQQFWPYFTRDGVLHYLGAPHTQSLTSKGTLNKGHLRGRVRVKTRNAKAEDQIGQVQIIAVGGDQTVYESVYPTTPTSGSIYEVKSGIWADSQGQADTLAQNLYEWLTRPYTIQVQVDAGLILFGDDGTGIDLGHKIAVTYDGPTEDTATGAGVNVNWSAQAFYVYKYWIPCDPFAKQAKGFLELEIDN